MIDLSVLRATVIGIFLFGGFTLIGTSLTLPWRRRAALSANIPATPLGLGLFVVLSTGCAYFLPFDRYGMLLGATILGLAVVRLIIVQPSNRGAALREQSIGFLSGIPAVLLSNWQYLLFRPAGTNIPTASADLLSFATTADWLRQHSYFDLLADQPRTIGWSWLSYQVKYFFPIGDASLTNIIAGGTTLDPLRAAQLSAAVCSGLIAVSVYGLLRMSRRTRPVALMGGALVSCMTVNIENALSVSVASQLGVALFIGWLSAAIAYLAPDEDSSHTDSPVPLIIFTASLVVAYPQYALLLAPTAITILWFAKNQRLRLFWSLVIGVIINPFAVYTAVRFFLFTSTSADANTYRSPLVHDSFPNQLLRWTGLGPMYTKLDLPWFAWIVLGTFVLLIVISLFQRDHNRLMLPLFATVAVGLAEVVVLQWVVPAPYSQFRLVKMLLPVAVLALFLALAQGRWRRTASAILCVTVAASTCVYLATSEYMSRASVDDRTVDNSYRQLDRWVDQLGDSESEILFLSDDFFTTHFALFEMRKSASIRHPILPIGYLDGSSGGPWTARPSRYVIVDRNASGVVDQSAIVRENHRFIIIDTMRGNYNVLLRSRGADLLAGHHPLASTNYPRLRLHGPMSLFVSTNSASAQVTFDCDHDDTNSPHWVAVTVHDNVHGEFDKTIIKLDGTRMLTVPVKAKIGWAEINILPLSPDADVCAVRMTTELRTTE